MFTILEVLAALYTRYQTFSMILKAWLQKDDRGGERWRAAKHKALNLFWSCRTTTARELLNYQSVRLPKDCKQSYLQLTIYHLLRIKKSMWILLDLETFTDDTVSFRFKLRTFLTPRLYSTPNHRARLKEAIIHTQNCSLTQCEACLLAFQFSLFISSFYNRSTEHSPVKAMELLQK